MFRGDPHASQSGRRAFVATVLGYSLRFPPFAPYFRFSAFASGTVIGSVLQTLRKICLFHIMPRVAVGVEIARAVPEDLGARIMRITEVGRDGGSRSLLGFFTRRHYACYG